MVDKMNNKIVPSYPKVINVKCKNVSPSRSGYVGDTPGHFLKLLWLHIVLFLIALGIPCYMFYIALVTPLLDMFVYGITDLCVWFTLIFLCGGFGKRNNPEFVDNFTNAKTHVTEHFDYGYVDENRIFNPYPYEIIDGVKHVIRK
jgi:hypothetical protein